MNDTYSAYSLADGTFTGLTISVPAAELAANTPPGCGMLAGAFDAERWRVDLASGNAVPVVQVRPVDTVDLTWGWDETLGRYVATVTLHGARAHVLSAAALALASIDRDSGTDRAVRDLLLASSISAQARARIETIEARATAVRALVARCEQAATVEQVDAIASELQALQVVQATA